MAMRYVDALKKTIDEAKPAVGLSRAEIELRISAINDALKRPRSNAERIMLCEERASLRKALPDVAVKA